MKRVVLVIGLVICSSSLQAQTWDEWFRQKKTQRIYLVNQIAALQVYLGYLREGYEVARKGLGMIDAIKRGDFELHDAFFNALESVSPVIRNSAVVADIILVQKQILNQVKRILAIVDDCGQFTGNEVVHFKKVADRLLEGCRGFLREAMMVITDGELVMNDDERLRRLEMIRNDLVEHYGFCRYYKEDTLRTAMQRLAEELEVERSRQWYGLN
jgi:hypothetical protein